MATILGCGTTKTFTATEQLLMSDAVDSTVAKFDFSPLEGQHVFLDTTFLSGAKTNPNVPNSALTPPVLINGDYVVSSIRQQMIAAGCCIEEKREDADLVAEIRIGALGTDGHSIIYGLPANNLLNSASSVVSGAQALPTIPEISLAKKELKSGAAKVAVFAYNRETHDAVWQSGIEQAGSHSRDTWILGIGPFQRGSIYENTRFAGNRLFQSNSEDSIPQEQRQGIGLRQGHFFAKNLKRKEPESISSEGGPALAKDDAGKSSDVITASSASSTPSKPTP